MASIGRITNLSLSGGFITCFGLRPLARIHVSLEYPLVQPAFERLPAFVARVCEEGAGIVWCEFAPRVVADILRTMSDVLARVSGTAAEPILPHELPYLAGGASKRR